MKAIPWIITLALMLAACATDVVPLYQVTGGSRADGVVILAYAFGPFQVPKYDPGESIVVARATCAGWGYPDARLMSGPGEQCADGAGFSIFGGCEYAGQITIKYQCTGAGVPR